MTPQIGLIPLGQDPVSKLEEFLHLETHPPDVPPPTRNVNGRFPVEDDIGLVLVLIPGGIPGETFWMGAQNVDVSADNYDPSAIVEEGWEQRREMPCPRPQSQRRAEPVTGSPAGPPRQAGQQGELGRL